MKCEAYVDGACIGNPGPGGWGFHLKVPGQPPFEHSGGYKDTTNNQMELMAAIGCLMHVRGLKAAGTPIEQLTIITDSQYVKNGITSWIVGWKKKGWVNSNREPVKNKDIWMKLDSLRDCPFAVEWKWVKGHSGNPGNDRADALATAAAKRYMRGQETLELTGNADQKPQSGVATVVPVRSIIAMGFDKVLRDFKADGLTRAEAMAAIESVFPTS